jgi:hypothetical protein
MKHKILLLLLLTFIGTSLFANFGTWSGVEMTATTYSIWYFPICLLLNAITIYFLLPKCDKNKVVLLLIFMAIFYILGPFILSVLGIIFAGIVGFAITQDFIPDLSLIDYITTTVVGIIGITMSELLAVKLYYKKSSKKELIYLLLNNTILIVLALLVAY